MRDDKGYVDTVPLHQGTIINPTGLTLQPGMDVSVLGYNAGSYFAANEVDTPYTYYGGAPYYLGQPWNYYGPSFGIGLSAGNPGWGPYYGGYGLSGYCGVYRERDSAGTRPFAGDTGIRTNERSGDAARRGR